MSQVGFGGEMPKARILAVDDQLYFRVFLEDLLTQEGYEVRTASSGEEALHLFGREEFDIVLTDLVMPGMEGAELVQRLKEARGEQEIVVVTSVGDVKTAVDAMKVGATDYLLKPIDRTILTIHTYANFAVIKFSPAYANNLGCGTGSLADTHAAIMWQNDPDRIAMYASVLKAMAGSMRIGLGISGCLPSWGGGIPIVYRVDVAE